MPDPPEKEPVAKTEHAEEKNPEVKIHQLTEEELKKLSEEQKETSETLIDDAIHGGTAG